MSGRLSQTRAARWAAAAAIVIFGGPALAALGRSFDYNFIQAPTAVLDIASGTPARITLPGVLGTSALIWGEVHAAADSATPTDDQDNVWMTPTFIDGSGHRQNLSVKCPGDTVAGDYNIDIAIGGRTFLVIETAEYGGIENSSNQDCIADSSDGGNQDPADTDPLTGATMDCDATCLLAGFGVSAAAITSDNNQRVTGASSTTIRMTMGDKRVTAAGSDALTWDISAGPSLSLSVMLQEAAAAGSSARPGQINAPTRGGGTFDAAMRTLGVWRPVGPARLIQARRFVIRVTR